MKLADWAREEGISYLTAYRWWKKGILPVPAKQMETGTILLSPKTRDDENGVALYARVSSRTQKDDLVRQLGRMVEYANNNKMKVVKSVSEVSSGLNGHRPKLMRLLIDPHISIIVVENRDRLARFDSEYIKSALADSRKEVVAVDQSEMDLESSSHRTWKLRQRS